MKAQPFAVGVTEQLSIFDIFKIGVGPSSSHTLGPWCAAMQFANQIKGKEIHGLHVILFGSLSKTGRGHCTDIAVMMGLQGYDPRTVPTTDIPDIIGKINLSKHINVNKDDIPFDPTVNIVFENSTHEKHPNALTFRARLDDASLIEETYFSVGGGFIEQEKKMHLVHDHVQHPMPFPVVTGDDLIRHTSLQKSPIWKIVAQNELHFRPAKETKTKALNIFQTMIDCAFRGAHIDGILPGGLNVKRRAKALNSKLIVDHDYETAETWIEAVSKSPKDFNTINKWISCFALAVNEENAALGRVVTSPTNGAAGVIPAVLLYYRCFCDYQGEESIIRFLMTSGVVGSLFKQGATISAAVGGCQAEVGVSSAMAAAGLTEVLGGSPEQALMAAEIAMEHHLGLTCDPIGGLVQVPCIERNAMGAMKAITAANLALDSEPTNAIVNFDLVVKTMWDTANDMHHNYKETSEGGLAYNLPVVMPNC